MPPISGLERCLTVLDGGVPDRVPVGLLDFMPAAAAAGLSMREYCTSGERMAEAHIAAWERFGHDLIDLENGVAALAGAVGCDVGFDEDSSPPWVTGPAITSIEEVGSLRPIDPAADGTLPEMIKATRLIAAELGERVCLLAEADQGPFSLAAQIVGIEEFLVALLDPGRAVQVERLLDYATEQVITYGRALTDAGAHLTMMGESVAGPDVCAPDIYRRYAVPRERQVVATLAAEGRRMGMHICGDSTHIIGDMVGTGAAFLQVDSRIDRSVAKRAARGRTTLMGTVDPSEVMARGSSDAVRAAAASDIKQLGNGGGFILAPGCALPYDTPPENIAALVETAAATTAT